MLIVNADIEGRNCAVRIGETIQAVGQLQPLPNESIYDAQGGRLLPGLHDHHIHLRAMAARRGSVDLASADIRDLPKLGVKLGGSGWIRAVGYHADRHGELNRAVLDELCPSQPVRVQHSSGKMWVVNSPAIEALEIGSDSHAGVEVDQGRLTGRLFRMDKWLGERLRGDTLDLAPLLEDLLRLGITSVTDTSFNNDEEAEQELKNLKGLNGKPYDVHCMGDESLVCGGQLKILLDEDQLPDLDGLHHRVARAHERDRGVAFHCVSRIEMLVVMECLQLIGVHPNDRIEHGAMIGDEMIEDLANLAVPVVTQPGFLSDRGERFCRELKSSEISDLYRYKSLIDAGIQVVCSSDAPYGPVDPWQCIHAASYRLSEDARAINSAECVSAETALEGYLLQPDLLSKREIAPGSPANFCLLEAGGSAKGSSVHRVWFAGQPVPVSS